MAKKVIKYEATKEDYEFGNLSLDQLFNLMYLTSYFVLKFKINDILDMLDWENEIRYMSRRKGETKEQNREPSHMEVYKGDNAEMVSKQ